MNPWYAFFAAVLAPVAIGGCTTASENPDTVGASVLSELPKDRPGVATIDAAVAADGRIIRAGGSGAGRVCKTVTGPEPFQGCHRYQGNGCTVVYGELCGREGDADGR